MSKKVDVPRQPPEVTEPAIPVSQSITALEPAPALGGFDGLDRVEMAPMTAAEERAERRARRAEADFVRTEARKNKYQRKLHEIERDARARGRATETQKNLAAAVSLQEMLAGDLRARGFTMVRIKKLFALLSRTPLTAEQVAQLIASHQVK
jgi:hypothetical protein